MGVNRNLSPLFRLAIKSGAADAVSLHIRRGEAANGRDGAGLTPLMIAAVHGRLEVCLRLLDAGAEPDLLSPGGKSASELATEHGYAEISAHLSHFGQAKTESVPKQDWAPIFALHSGLAAKPGFAPALDQLRVPPLEPSVNPALAPEVHDVLNQKRALPAELGSGFEAVSGSVAVVEEETVPEVNRSVDRSLRHAAEMEDCGGGDGSWLPDNTGAAPEHDESCAAAAIEAQRRMSIHRRISDDFDWSDIELDLPEVGRNRTPLARDVMDAIAQLVATGLEIGYVTTADLWKALELDCGTQIERAHLVVLRVLDDLGILVESEGVQLPLAGTKAGNDELDGALDVLHDDLLEPADFSAFFIANVRKLDLIKREDEERFGRRMDSALGELTRALASLGEQDWQLAFPKALQEADRELASEHDEEGAEESEIPDPTDDATDDLPDGDGEKIDFAAYVELVRNGASEYGRNAAVPRPCGRDLTRLVDLAPKLESVCASSVTASIASYETARNQLVSANLRLALSLAHGYRNRGLPLEDLIQDANIGLIRAAEGYDFRRGFKFSTYATWWIRQSVSRAVMDTSRTIRVPVHMGEKIGAVIRARRELEYGREGEVSASEIAARLSLRTEEVRRLLRADARVLSFDECGLDKEPNTPDLHNIADPAADPSQSSCDRSLTKALQRMLAEFSEKDRGVLMSRYGFDGFDFKTLEEVGQQFNVTRERIRQIEAKALRILRHRSRLDVLMPYAGSNQMSEN